MPTYEYRCTNPLCATPAHVEVKRGVNDPEQEIRCRCGEVLKKQLPNGVGISFKGPGFHVNDYNR